MIGLRSHARDAELAARAGDWRVPSERELLELVARELAPRALPVAAQWTFARWKPRTALTLAHEVRFEDGTGATVVTKLHAGAKLGAPRPYAVGERALRPFAVVAPERLTLSSFPYDRELPGLERCFDLRRLARHVDDLGVFMPLRMRPGPSKLAVLRYKPERRAVLRLDLRLRETKDSARHAASMILRVHPASVASASAEQRLAFDAAAPRDLAPRLLGHEARAGVLFEEWLDVRPFSAERFEHAPLAGALLARLHAVPATGARPPRARESFVEWHASVPEFAHFESLFALEDQPARGWIHGDFHPDQVALVANGSSARLLDLDALRVGAPCEDLAQWIADHVAAGARDWRAAAAALLDGYRALGGTEPDESALASEVARALVRSAAAALRRLERGAEDLARGRLQRAREILAECSAPRVAVRLERTDVAKDGAWIRTESHAGERRWFEERDGARRELTWRADELLPLSQRTDELEREGTLTVLAYRPGRRLVLRWTMPSGASSILKGYRRGRDSDAFERATLAYAAAGDAPIALARVEQHWVEHSTLAFEDLGGRTVELGTLAPARLAEFGRALSRFQRAAPSSATRLEVHGLQSELDTLDALRQRFAGLGAESIAGLARAREALQRALETVESRAVALAHRDLHDGQLLDLGTRLGWIDFDLTCRADDALDAANFVAHLGLRRLQGAPGLDAAREAALRDAFLEGLGHGADLEFARRLCAYESATCLRLALVYCVRPPWAHLSAVLAATAERLARSLVR
ncbi:MAG: hypothetical protein IT454_06675 [Planctomycetes bacterium]|nr:hypothetical protein [Planctomycetota bacterium]